MQDIETHERRLRVALLRIGAAAERLAEPPPGGAAEAEADTAAEVEIARLARALEEERARADQAAERLATLRDRHHAGQATLEARIGALTAQIDAQGVDLQRLRMVNVQLREALRSLRDIAAEGLADPGQINRALQAEAEALHTTRQIESAELDALLDALEPLTSAAEGENAGT